MSKELFLTIDELTTAQRNKLKESVADAVTAKRDAKMLSESIVTTRTKLKEDDDIDPGLFNRLMADRYDQLYNASEGIAKIKNRADKVAEVDVLFGTKSAEPVEGPEA